MSQSSAPGPARAFEDVPDHGDDQESRLLTELIHYRASGQQDRARTVCLDLLSQDPENVFVLSQLGYANLGLEDWEASEQAFHKAIALDPDGADHFIGLAYVYWFQNHYGKAEDHLRKSIALDPEDEEAWFLMTELSIHRNDAKQADYCLGRAAAIEPESERILEFRTRISALSGASDPLKPDQQVAAWKKMLSRNPESEEAHLRLGVLYYDELADYPQAEHHFRQLLRLDPANASYQKILVMALRQQDPLVKALQLPHFLAMKIFAFFSWCWETKWGLILLFPTAKFLIIAAVLLLLVYFVVCWPVVKAYEFLSRRELRKKLGRISFEHGWQEKVHRMSLTMRLTMLGTATIAYWGLLLAGWYYEGTRDQMLATTTLLVMAGAIGLVAFGWIIELRDARQKRKNKASLQQLQKSEG